MSWSPLAPQATRARPDRAAITVASSAGGGRLPAAIVIIIRTRKLEGGTFMSHRARVKILAGGGPHAGMLRIEPDGPFEPHWPSGKAVASGTLKLRIDLPHGVAPENRKPETVEYDHADDWIEITLPEWARPSAPAGVSPAPARPPHSISDRVPDPAATLRGAGARR
ncbi:hypothetical protein GXW74_15730 [Roseomonas eburnea]|uniref:Uncharacterized protein n=1 Tax=Neoroseomonas eburnea TaxID=1346889 RepID=A0A9X9XE09_9PROT|nr:hypothetical protein [Neoroseomonas eburnea]MBR0681945.1 hypothetical protein [Neoroseomonas eburnea]